MESKITVFVVCLLFTGAVYASPAPQGAAAPQSGVTITAGPDQVVVLRLSDNTLLVGKVVRQDDQTVVFDAGTLGMLTLKRTSILAQLDPATLAAAFQAPAASAVPGTVTGFAPKGKIMWTRQLGMTGFYSSSPYELGQLDPRFPVLTGKALRLPGSITNVQAQLSVQRASEHTSLSIDGSDVYVFADNAGKQADNPRISVGYNVRLKDSTRFFGVARQTYFRDGVRQIKYSNQTLLGLGIRTVDTKKTHLDLIPGYALQYDRQGTPFDDRVLQGGGFMDIFQQMVAPFAQIEQRLLVYRAFNESRYYGFESSVGFKGMVTKLVGVSIGLQNNLDNAIGLRPTPIPANALFPGQEAFSVLANKRSQATVTTGILIKF